MLFNPMVVKCCFMEWGTAISFSMWNETEKIQELLLWRQMGIKSSTYYHLLRLETGGQPIEVLAIQRVYKYITKSQE